MTDIPPLGNNGKAAIEAAIEAAVDSGGGGSGAVLTPPVLPGQFAIVNPAVDGLINGEASANAVQKAFDALWILRGNWSDSAAEGVLFGLGIAVDSPEEIDITTGLAFTRAVDGPNQQSYRSYIGGANLYSLFSPPDPVLDRIDLVTAQANPDTGVVIPAVVTGTPAASVPQITRFLQTGSPTSGTFKIRVQGRLHDGSQMDLTSDAIAFDADEVTIQNACNDSAMRLAVIGNANDFTLTENTPLNIGVELDFLTAQNTMDGGGDYTISNNQEATGPSVPSLPDNALELGRVFIPANQPDATQWIVDLSQVVHASIIPSYSEIAGIPIPIPAGGTTGQVLTKLSDADYDFAWVTP